MNRTLASLLRPAAGDRPSSAANLLLRLAYGGLVFWVHGVHKAEGAAGYFGRGEPWPLLDEVRGMGTPLPVPNAVLATLVQLLAPVFVALGLWTRPAAAVLAAILLGAVAQNLLAGRDPQLALLYTLVAATLAVWGAGAYSLDARRRQGPALDPQPDNRRPVEPAARTEPVNP